MKGPISRTFSEFHQTYGPGLFGSGKDEYLHLGQAEVYTRAPLSRRGEQELATTLARKEVAQRVKQAMERDYGDDAAEAALRRVHNKTGRLLDKEGQLLEMTRGDLELLHQELQKVTTEFTRLHETYALDRSRSGEGEYLHAEQDKSLRQGEVRLHTRAPLIPNGSGETTLARREKLEAATLVRQALARQYGRDNAEAALRKVRTLVYDTQGGRVLDAGMTRGDLDLLHKELHKENFTQLYNHFEAACLERPSDERVRGNDKEVYLHDPWMLHGNDDEGRRAKFKIGAERVRQAIINEFGQAEAKSALAALKKVADHNPEREITLGDLKFLNEELPKQKARYQELVKNLVANPKAEAKAITELYRAMTEAHPNDCSPKAMLERFEQLKAMVSDDWQAKFVAEINPPDREGRQAFTFKIDGIEIYRADRLQDAIEFVLRKASAIDGSPEAMFRCFQELRAASESMKFNLVFACEFPDNDGRWALVFEVGGAEIYRLDLQNGAGQRYIDFFVFALRQSIEANQLPDSVVQSILDQEGYVRGTISTMSDDSDRQAWIADNLDNPTFARVNFQRLEKIDDARFRAVYRQDGPDSEVEVEFSNRPSENGELRGEALQKMLAEGQYATLRDIAASGHLSIRDPSVKQAANYIWGPTSEAMGFATGNALSGYVASLQGEERKTVAGVLDSIKVGMASLADLYLPAAAPAQAQRGD